MLGLPYGNYYILMMGSIIPFAMATIKRSKTTDMQTTGRYSIALYAYAVLTFGVPASNMPHLEKTIIIKMLIVSGIFSFGFCTLTIMALLNAGWYIKRGQGGGN